MEDELDELNAPKSPLLGDGGRIKSVVGRIVASVTAVLKNPAVAAVDSSSDTAVASAVKQPASGWQQDSASASGPLHSQAVRGSLSAPPSAINSLASGSLWGRLQFGIWGPPAVSSDTK